MDNNSLYQDDFVRKFTLKHNVYPYRIGYTYQTVSKQFLGYCSLVARNRYGYPDQKSQVDCAVP